MDGDEEEHSNSNSGQTSPITEAQGFRVPRNGILTLLWRSYVRTLCTLYRSLVFEGKEMSALDVPVIADLS
jgi:hypothetical protein